MIQISKNDLSAECIVPQKVIHLGDELFLFCPQGKRWSKSFYVRVVVEENNYIWVSGDLCVYHLATKSGESLSTCSGVRDEYGWDLGREVSLEEFEKLRTESKLQIVNQIPWVDWPIGHAAYVGEDAFFTLEEARKCCGRFSKKKLGRRMRRNLRDTTTFIASTWKRGGYEKHPGFPPLDSWMRKGYV